MNPEFEELEQELAAIPVQPLSDEARLQIEKRLQEHAVRLGKPKWYQRYNREYFVLGASLAAAMLVIVAIFLLAPSSSSFTNDQPQTPTPPPSRTTTDLIIEGPVTGKTGNIISIFAITILIPEEHPLLAEINIGDTLYIEGIANSSSEAKFIATKIENRGDP